MQDERFDENINEETEEAVEETEQEEIVIEENEYREIPVTNIEEPKPRSKKSSKAATVVAIALIAGIVAGGAFSFTSTVVSKIVSARFKLQSTQSILTKADTDESVSLVADIVEEAMPSIVSISSKSVSEIQTWFGVFEQENMGSGSGIIIGKNDTELLVVTNYHVVADATDLSVMLSDVEIPTDAEEVKKMLDEEHILKAKVKGYDSDKDLAVISIPLNSISEEQFAKIKVATIGDSSKLRAGEQVIAIGNSLGYGQSVTQGIVSATNRAVTLQSQSSQSGKVTNTFIQTDAAINPGNSGGALLNMKGELIGINSVKIASGEVEGMGYAIPITDVEEIIGELMVRETRDVVDEDKQGFLGVTIKDFASEVASLYGIPEGVFVESVSEGSAADKAGIKKGYIITKLDNYSVKSGAQLQERLTYYKAGEKTTITVQVAGEDGYTEKTLDITLDSKKERSEIMENEQDD